MVSVLALVEHPCACEIHSTGARSAGRINLEDLLKPTERLASAMLKGFPRNLSRSISPKIDLFV